MKLYLFLSIALICGFHAESCSAQTRNTYTEATDPAPDTLADWSKVSKSLNASFGNTDTRYAKSAIPSLDVNVWSGSGWRGERVSAQAVLWSAADIGQVRCEFTPFRSGGDMLDADIAQARFVRYVITDSFGVNRPCGGARGPEITPPSLSPDMLDTAGCFDLEANTARPLWLTFDIPADAAPGIYSAKLKIRARKQKTRELDIRLEVLPQTLPRPNEWKFHLDLWQHPSAVARTGSVEPWSEEHWELLEGTMKMLADAGQKVITATVNKDPWNNQCYDSYGDMIVWTKNTDGTWTYDYGVFDRWVETMMGLGVKGMINCYSMVPWNNELHYYDAAAGKFTDVRAAPGSEEFAGLWTPFLTDFRRHLDEKGWLGITNIAMDERSPQDMKATLELLRETAPEFGVSLADNHKSYKQYPYLKDICVEYGAAFDAADLDYRKRNGLNSTWYVCCAHRFPNAFTFSDPAESAYIGWHTVAAGLDGFLRWAYNSWPEDPVTDSRFRRVPAGDTFIVYPGGRSSIRFERLREGIQDAEKIRILRESLSASPEKLNRLNETIAKFAVPAAPPETCAGMLNEAKKLLEELSR